MRAIGVAVVAARGAEGPAGLLALSVTHVTSDPPTLLVSIGKGTSALAAVIESGSFAVSYLPKDREDLAKIFGGQTDKKGANRFNPKEWTVLATGAPVLIDSIGSIDCRVEETIERYDTIIALGRIVDWIQGDPKPPLVSFAGAYL